MIDTHALLNAVIYAILGIVIFGGAFVLIDWLTPQDLWGEITEGKNVALAILVGLMSLGVCIIIAAAIH
jgi:uncharacterized membrane protein YjfL (UPF0719 family)